MSHRVLTIGMVAHDAQKPVLRDWAAKHLDILRRHKIYATGTTSTVLAPLHDDLDINAVLSGPLGGDQQLGAMICEGRLDILVFFQDPMTAQPHDVDVKALVRMAAIYDIPLACNPATATMLFASPLLDSID